MTAIHEIQQYLPVETCHGKGVAIMVIDYGPQVNTIWVVVTQKNGKIRHYDSSQIRVEANYTFRTNIK